jgi:lysine 2,3-aminomutase
MDLSKIATSKEAEASFNALASSQGMLPVKVTPYYRALVQEEMATSGRTGGPLYRTVFPVAEKLVVVPEQEVPDFVEDRTNMPVGLRNVAVHKYPNRLLFLITERCVGHCMYCFRQDVMTESRAAPPTDRLDALIGYLGAHPEIDEVILSGGDPMSLPFRQLEETLRRLRSETSIQHLRIHTRNMAFAPSQFSPRLAELLGRNRVRVYLHLVHPYEVTPQVRAAVANLRRAGVRLRSQFPILRSINDHPRVLSLLLETLEELEAPAVNLFVPDPISYSSAFRVPMRRLHELMDQLYWSTGSWLNGVRLVLDTPAGKVRREDIVAWDEARGEITYRRQERTVLYRDFPMTSDVPGELDLLLWKESSEARATWGGSAGLAV